MRWMFWQSAMYISNAACQKVAVVLALFELYGLALVVYHSNVCFLFWGVMTLINVSTIETQ
jgi:hypothetical protein